MERGATGLIYDESMKKHCCFWDPQHPECPERFSYVLQRYKDAIAFLQHFQITFLFSFLLKDAVN